MKPTYIIEIDTDGDPYIEVYTDDGLYQHYKGHNKDELLLEVLSDYPSARLSSTGKSITIKESGKTTERKQNKANSILTRAMKIGGFEK